MSLIFRRCVWQYKGVNNFETVQKTNVFQKISFKKVLSDSGVFQYGITKAEMAGLPEAVCRILDMNNAPAEEIRKYNVQKAIDLFKAHDADVGSLEVQIAVMTVKIESMIEHHLNHHKDHKTKRALVQLLQRRRRFLVALKNTSLPRYFDVIHKLKLDAPKEASRTRPANIPLPKK